MELGSDEKFMARAIELAQKGLGNVSPNPMVGCVIVKDGTSDYEYLAFDFSPGAHVLLLRTFRQEKCVWVAAKWPGMTLDDRKTATSGPADGTTASSVFSGTVNQATVSSKTGELAVHLGNVGLCNWPFYSQQIY